MEALVPATVKESEGTPTPDAICAPRYCRTACAQFERPTADSRALALERCFPDITMLPTLRSVTTSNTIRTVSRAEPRSGFRSIVPSVPEERLDRHVHGTHGRPDRAPLVPGRVHRVVESGVSRRSLRRTVEQRRNHLLLVGL